MNLSPEVSAFVIGVFITNIGFIFGAYVSLKVSNAKLETLVGVMSEEVNSLKDDIKNLSQKIKKGLE